LDKIILKNNDRKESQSAEIVLPRLQSIIKVALFLFISRLFLANNLRFMVKLIEKTILINVKYIRMREKKGFIQAIKKVNLIETKESLKSQRYILHQNVCFLALFPLKCCHV
jgi:hypothetical protein